jgi:D-alanyl-D-alanine carboxypeptidase/D-alanyl-D-alanine-endopeptidase (penicillin-binding protein 4)
MLVKTFGTIEKVLACFGVLSLWFISGLGQTGSPALLRRFLADEQLKYAVVGFELRDASNRTVLAHQANYGLAPASCLKVITAASAYEFLGGSYRYPTTVFHSGQQVGNVLQGDLLVEGSGDPTTGSWRYADQPDTLFFEMVFRALKKRGISKIEGDVRATNASFSFPPIPGGWTYDDMGNYYGAGHWALNFRENQYDISFRTNGTVGDPVSYDALSPHPGFDSLYSLAKIGAPGSGDNSIVFSAPYQPFAFVTGTVGKSAKPVPVSGALPDGERTLMAELRSYLQKRGIDLSGNIITSVDCLMYGCEGRPKSLTVYTHQSMPLDSIAYWFLHKSVNLYGEAFIRTIAYQKGMPGHTDSGISLVKTFWEQKGIDKDALRIYDGSGLSPSNRVTASALTRVLHHASGQPWFSAYYHALPEVDGKKMKSGTIAGCKGYTGYLTGKSGKRYSFALLVNNYRGSSGSLVQKMWKFLDAIKAQY